MLQNSNLCNAASCSRLQYFIQICRSRLEKYVQWRSFNIASERLILPSAYIEKVLRPTTWPANSKLLSQTRITFQYKLLSITGLNIPADGVYITLNRCRFVRDIGL
jgi:hypothetical protein